MFIHKNERKKMLKNHAHKKLIMSWKFEDSVAKQNPTGLFTAYKRIAHKKVQYICVSVCLSFSELFLE